MEDFTKGKLSPNGQFLVCQDYSTNISLYNLTTLEVTVLDLPKTEYSEIIWSKNSDRLGIIQKHETIEDTDVLTLLRIKVEVDGK